MGRIARRVRQAGVYFVTAQTWQRRALFSKPEMAGILLAHVLECRERGFYKLHAFVIMPNHLHALLTPGEDATLEKGMQMIKGGSAYKIRKQFHKRFPVWQSSFHDRWIRDAAEYTRMKLYIEQNPIQKRLALKIEDYVLGSACGQYPLDPSQFDGDDVRG